MGTRVAWLRRARTSLFYGWWVLAGAMIVNAIGGGIYSYGFAVFFLPLRESLGIGAASAALIFSLSRAEGAIEGPIAGYLIDRFGARRMIAIGATLMAVGYVLLATAQSYLAVLIIYLFVIAAGFNCGFGHATLALVNNWFVRNRSFAMALATAAFSFGGALIAPLLGLGVAFLGWRPTAALAGVAILVLILPVLLLVRRSPESMGLRPDGDAEPTDAELAVLAAERSRRGYGDEYTLKEAMRTPTFWWLLLATSLRIAVGGAMTVHFVAIMVWKGSSETAAAGLLGLFALISVPLRVIVGSVGDRHSKTAILAITMALGTLSLLFLNYGSGQLVLLLFVALFALVESNPALNWALLGDYFGRVQFATIRGSMSFFYGWVQMSTPLIAGLLWDMRLSYDLALWMFAIMWLVGAAVFALLRPPRRTPAPVPVA